MGPCWVKHLCLTIQPTMQTCEGESNPILFRPEVLKTPVFLRPTEQLIGPNFLSLNPSCLSSSLEWHDEALKLVKTCPHTESLTLVIHFLLSGYVCSLQEAGGAKLETGVEMDCGPQDR